MATPIGMRKQVMKAISLRNQTNKIPDRKLTAIVFMPVKSITIADPSRTNIYLTIMFVVKL
jgi:hypothetical protein